MLGASRKLLQVRVHRLFCYLQLRSRKVRSSNCDHHDDHYDGHGNEQDDHYHELDVPGSPSHGTAGHGRVGAERHGSAEREQRFLSVLCLPVRPVLRRWAWMLLMTAFHSLHVVWSHVLGAA